MKMTEFLVKHFVKNYEKVSDVKVRTAYGILASFVGIGCNLILFAAKLAVGLVINSISVMADAFNNLSDAASSIIGFVGVKMAEKPADEDHPFGHGRIEYISAFIVAFIVIQVGFSLFKTSIDKIRNPESMTFSLVSVLILVLSIGVKLWLALFNRSLGKRIQSTVMMATAADALGDVMTTSATILSVIIFGVTGWNLDGFFGLAVSVVVMIAGVNIAKDTLTPLIGEPIDPSIYHEITEFVEKYDGIIGTHDLIVHNYGPSRSMASIHAEVPSKVDIEISHAVVDQIERDALEKLQLNDASLFFERETSIALGFGFRCGFLGLLHLEIIQERLEREYNLDLVTTAPGVVYRIHKTNGEVIDLTNPSNMPDPSEIEYMEEPIVSAEIMVTTEFVGAIMQLCQERRGVYLGMEYMEETRALLKYELPLNEIIYDFFDALKSRSRGYASFDYELKGYEQSQLVKLDILINKETVDALSFIVFEGSAYERGRKMCEKLKDEIPKHLFEIPIQAAVGGKIIARETVRAMRKDVLAKCYGGDISRKKKLLEKQKEGKKRMRQVGNVEIPQKAFMSVLKLDEE